MKNQLKNTLNLTPALIAAIHLSACGSSDDDINARTFPLDLALASPTQSGASQALSARLGRILEAKPMSGGSRSSNLQNVYGEDYATLVAALANMVISPTSESDCSFNLDLAPTFENATCYGPQLTYTGHPDGSPNSGTLPSGDVGLWEATESTTGEACAAAQINARMNGIAKLANGGVFLAASVYCSATVSGTSLPTRSGGSVDLTSQFAANVSSGTNAVTVTNVDVACTDDDGSKCTEYVVTLEGTSGSKEINLRMKHQPTNSTGTRYAGKISYTIEDPAATGPNCLGAGVTGITYAASVSYEKPSSSEMTYQLNSGMYCGIGEDPYVSATDFTVDASKKALQTGGDTEGWADNFTRATASFDPDSGEGDYSLTWEAGSNDGYARSMLAHIEQLAATNAGVAYFGFGPEPEDAGAGEIDGMICNWAGPGASHGSIASTTLAQKQVFAKSSSLYTAASSNITYAPTNACTITAAGPVFTQVGGGGTSNITASQTVAHNLVSASEVSISVPAAPTNVD
jgi:hypothetical protein